MTYEHKMKSIAYPAKLEWTPSPEMVQQLGRAKRQEDVGAILDPWVDTLLESRVAPMPDPDYWRCADAIFETHVRLRREMGHCGAGEMAELGKKTIPTDRMLGFAAKQEQLYQRVKKHFLGEKNTNDGNAYDLTAITYAGAAAFKKAMSCNGGIPNAAQLKYGKSADAGMIEPEDFCYVHDAQAAVATLLAPQIAEFILNRPVRKQFLAYYTAPTVPWASTDLQAMEF